EGARLPAVRAQDGELGGEDGLQRIEDAPFVVDDQYRARFHGLAPSGELQRHRNALSQPKDLVKGLPALEALELGGTQLAVPHQVADRAEGSLRGDYMRAEQARHALDGRRRG